MDKDKFQDYLEALELEENATLKQIEAAHNRLIRLYSSDSMVLEPIDDEFEDSDKQEILDSIEEAYLALKNNITHPSPENDPESQSNLEQQPLEVPSSLDEETLESGETQEFPDPIEIPEHFELPEVEEIPQIEEIQELEDIQEPLELPEHPELDGHLEPFKAELEDTIVEEDEEEDIPGQLDPTQDVIYEEETTNPFKLEEISEHTEPIETSMPEETPEPVDFNTKDLELGVTIVKPPSDIPLPTTGLPESTLNPETDPFKGKTLRKIREQKGIGIHELAISTKIHYKILVNIEKERFDKLPESGYLRWHVTTYAKALELNTHQVADDYMKRYRQWLRTQES
jgi:Helix-turn-helix domain